MFFQWIETIRPELNDGSTPFSLETNLAFFYTQLGFTVPASFNENTPATIRDAFGRNAGGNSGNLGVARNQKGLWKQRTTGFLNSLLWEYLYADCENDENCDYLQGNTIVSDEFYFPWTLAEVWNKDQSALAATVGSL